MKTTTNITYPAFALFAFACFAFSPQARAVCQQGCDSANTFLGMDALINNTFGLSNTAVGFEALTVNTIGNSNTAIGVEALRNNTTGSSNTAVGYFALVDNHGSNNTATGLSALLNNFAGSDNTATGYAALLNNTSGHKNIAVGFQAGGNLTNGSYNIDIGNPGIAGESDTIRIGNRANQTATYVAGISGATVPGGVTVVVDAFGHLGTTTSSARFKEAIKPMDNASEAILALKPVTFRYKKDVDLDGIPQFGLVAEEVEKVNPDLVARDEQGKPYTVRYEAVNAMLLNEFLKEHRKVEEQQAAIKQLESRVAQYEDLRSTVAQQQNQIQFLAASLKEQVSQIQKISAELAAASPSSSGLDVSSRRTPQLVLNDQ